MKSLNTKISLASITFLLLIGTSLLGFSFVMPTAVASSSIDDTTTTTTAQDNGGTATATMSGNTSLNATTTPTTPTTTSTVELAEEPFAVGHYRTVFENMITETEAQFSVEGNTTITLPNSTETITTRDTGEGTFSLLPGGSGGSPSGQIHMNTEDESESATGYFTEFIKFDSSTGIGVAYFSTNSTGVLAPLNNMIAVFLDEVQPNEDSIVRFYEWKSHGGAPIDNGGNVPTIAGGNDTTTTTTEIPAVLMP
jgi:hypothetical protein